MSEETKCECRQCLRDRVEMIGGLPAEMCRMVVCGKCGNKRCPHATDHRLACTGSNQPGQEGSAWESVASQEPALARCHRPGVTHHAGCACHEQGWKNKWRVAVEMAARAENERDELRLLAGELVAFIRVNVARDTFAGATIEQVEEHLAPFVARLNPLSP